MSSFQYIRYHIPYPCRRSKKFQPDLQVCKITTLWLGFRIRTRTGLGVQRPQFLEFSSQNVFATSNMCLKYNTYHVNYLYCRTNSQPDLQIHKITTSRQGFCTRTFLGTTIVILRVWTQQRAFSRLRTPIVSRYTNY